MEVKLNNTNTYLLRRLKIHLQYYKNYVIALCITLYLAHIINFIIIVTWLLLFTAVDTETIFMV